MKPLTALAALTLIAAPTQAQTSGTLTGMYYCQARRAGFDKHKAIKWAQDKATPPAYPLNDMTAAVKQYVEATNPISKQVESNNFVSYVISNCPEFVQ